MENERLQRPEAPLDFRPITDGLGFHPFSDGLPYAPVVKTGAPTPAAARMGAGAEAAGPARYVVPASEPRLSPSRPAAGRVSVPVAMPSRSPMRTQAASSMAASKSEPTPEKRFESSYGMIYLVKRSLAYLVDIAFNSALCLGALSSALWNQNLKPELLFNPSVAFVAALFVAVFSWALVTAEEIAFGTSIGKRIFGLALQGSASAVFIRAFFFVPSLGFCGLGLLWSIFDKRRRCWHDVVVDLQPLEIARL